jgi:hypothetical protein
MLTIFMAICRGSERIAAPFFRKLGYIFPGESFTPNITPANLGSWSDGEVYRLLTTGIDKDGKTINHAMPFQNFSHLKHNKDKEIIAYIIITLLIKNNNAEVTKIKLFTKKKNRTISGM